MVLLCLSTLLGPAKAAPVWDAESLSNQNRSFESIMSDPHVFALCSQGAGYPLSALLCKSRLQTSWKIKNLNSGKI